MASADLIGQLRIRKQRTCQTNNVCLAGFDNLLHQIGITQTADSGNWRLDHLLDCLGILHVATVRHKHVGEHLLVGLRIMERTGRNMDKVHLTVNQLGKLYLIFNGQTTLNILCAAHAKLNEQIGALFADILNDH